MPDKPTPTPHNYANRFGVRSTQRNRALDRIDIISAKKKIEELTEVKPNDIYSEYYKQHYEQSKLINQNITYLYSQIEELKKAILISTRVQSDSIKDFNKTIKEIAPIILPFTVSTKVINTWSLKVTNIYHILKRNGTGIIREARISTENNFSIYLKTDDTELLNLHSSFDELVEISKLSNDILTIKDNDLKTVILKNIRFNKSIDLSTTFKGDAFIKTIFCIYDIKEK